MLYQFHCFAALLHLPQTKWKGEKWTVVASMNAFRLNKAWQNRPDKLKIATLGRSTILCRGGYLARFWIISQQPGVLLLERKGDEERERKEGKVRCAWIINSPELYMGDKNSGWITGTAGAVTHKWQMCWITHSGETNCAAIRLNLRTVGPTLTNVRKSGNGSWWWEIQLGGIEATSHQCWMSLNSLRSSTPGGHLPLTS